MAPRTKIDLGVALVAVAVGAVFLWEGWRIDPRSAEAVGPRFMPVLLAAALMGLGALVGLAALWRARAGAVAPLRADGEFGFAGSDLRRVGAVIGAGAVYAVAFWAVGYMAATALGMLLALLAFGVRRPWLLVVLPVAAAVAYQALFMGVMGLLDPRGALVDLRWLAAPVTPR